MFGQPTAAARVRILANPEWRQVTMALSFGDFVRKDRHQTSFDIRRISGGKMTPLSNITGN